MVDLFFYRAQEEEIDQDQLVFATFLSVRMCVCVCVFSPFATSSSEVGVHLCRTTEAVKTLPLF